MAKKKTEETSEAVETVEAVEEKTVEETLAEMMNELKALKKEQEALKKENNALKEKSIVVNENPINPVNEEEVTVQLFKDKGKYKDDVFIAVNGERIQIQRGVPVTIKKKFAKVLERSLKQDAETAELISKETEDWAEKSKKL